MVETFILFLQIFVKIQFASHDGYCPNVESQVITPKVSVPGLGLEPRTLACKADVLTTTLLQYCCRPRDDTHLISETNGRPVEDCVFGIVRETVTKDEGEV